MPKTPKSSLNPGVQVKSQNLITGCTHMQLSLAYPSPLLLLTNMWVKYIYKLKEKKVQKTNPCGWISVLPSSSTQNETKYRLLGVAQFSLLLNYESKYSIFLPVLAHVGKHLGLKLMLAVQIIPGLAPKAQPFSKGEENRMRFSQTQREILSIKLRLEHRQTAHLADVPSYKNRPVVPPLAAQPRCRPGFPRQAAEPEAPWLALPTRPGPARPPDPLPPARALHTRDVPAGTGATNPAFFTSPSNRRGPQTGKKPEPL